MPRGRPFLAVSDRFLPHGRHLRFKKTEKIEDFSVSKRVESNAITEVVVDEIAVEGHGM